MLSTPNTGVGSAYTGLGAGFTRVSDRLRASKEEDAKMRQQIGFQAAQMAMQSEEKALDFLREYETEVLKYKNKRGDLLTFQKELPDGKIEVKTIRDNYANDAAINDLLANGYFERGSGSSISVNTGPKYSKRDEEAVKAQVKAEEEILEKYRAGNYSVFNLKTGSSLIGRCIIAANTDKAIAKYHA